MPKKPKRQPTRHVDVNALHPAFNLELAIAATLSVERYHTVRQLAEELRQDIFWVDQAVNQLETGQAFPVTIHRVNEDGKGSNLSRAVKLSRPLRDSERRLLVTYLDRVEF